MGRPRAGDIIYTDSSKSFKSSFSALAFSGKWRLANELEPTLLISKASSALTNYFRQLEPVPQFTYM